MPGENRVSPPTDEWELFLLGLRYRDSRLLTLSGNEPFLLSGANKAWLVYKGVVDVFAVRTEDGQPAGARHHFFRAYTHQLLTSLPDSDQQVGLLASCAPETQVLQFKLSRLKQLLDRGENSAIILSLIETWTRTLASGLIGSVRPREYRTIAPGAESEVSAGEIIRPQRDVVWVQQSAGQSRFMGREDLTLDPGEALMPLTERTWLQAAGEGMLRAVSTSDLLAREDGWDILNRFGALVQDLIAQDMQQERHAAARLIQEKIADDELKVQSAVTRLAATWREEPLAALDADSPDSLVAVCRLVARALGVQLHLPPDYDSLAGYKHPLAEIARASRLRMRHVLLRDDWWQRDNGPLLAYRGDDHHPVALLPLDAGHYTLHDPDLRETLPVDEALAAELDGNAYLFYRPFPGRPLSALDLVRFGQRGAANDLLVLLVVGLAGGVLALLVPIITGVVFDRLIPAGDQGQLLVFGGVLAASAIAVALFQGVRGLVLLRIEGRMDSAIQAAVWDRLLSLPTAFYRRYTAGDLTQRAMGITTIKQTLSGAVAVSLLAGVFSWFNVALMLYYDAGLALIALGIMLISLAVTVGLGAQLLRYQREVTHTEGAISGLIAQLIGGISKLRVAGAESRAFFLWATTFSQQKKLAFRARSALNTLTVFDTVYPILASMAIFAALYTRTSLSPGRFLAFNAAFAQFMAAGLQFGIALIAALSVVPVYERLRPILHTLPEIDEQKTYPGELSGAIEVNHLSFRYAKEGPQTLDDVTFSVMPGEFVAVVGSSGSGKSTLLRHLLGFEWPDSGAVYYDGQALSEIDLRAVRRQIGVVLQHSQVVTGTIQENIIGATNLTAEDAWDAARRAGIAGDIQQMPMGMQTYISEGASTFSGGQRQRLLIARALVTRPRIILFDEATSALDDRSQALVTESLKQVDATRIVIAHRLSTIVDADRILVMQRGKLVESGTYQTLMDQGGAFAQLAQRQLI